MQAVILAAGQGLRLRPMTETLPKAMIDIDGKPLVEHILDALPSEVTEIFLVVGYLHEQIEQHLGDHYRGLPIRYMVQDTLDGTGSALHLLRDALHGRFLVVNGDDLYTKVDLERLISHPLALLALPTEDDVPASALVDKHGRFQGLEHHAPSAETKLRVCGAYVLDERFFTYPLATIRVHGRTEHSLPHTLIALSRDLDIHVEQATDWQPVGTPQELEAARLYDRDGSPPVGKR